MAADATSPNGAGPSNDSGESPVKVLFIGGWGRSGSTLLDRTLGQVPGFVSVGELRELWQRGCLENRPCGCEHAFHDCPFWRAVGEEAFGGWENVDYREMARLRERLDRAWSVPVTSVGGLSEGQKDAVRRYTDALSKVYRAIRTVTSAEVVIDSGKIPSHAYLLRRIPAVDMRVVHLVRDSRGVAYSWQKWVHKKVSSGEPDYLYRFNPVGASVRWVVYNGMTQSLGWLGSPYLFLRYEDFVADPRAQLRRILELMDVEERDDTLAFVRDGGIHLTPNHTVDGNPMRFLEGSVPLRLDEEWRGKLAGKDRRTVTAMTLPLLVRYGYASRR